MMSVPLKDAAPDQRDRELKLLKAQLKGMEILLEQNADLEREVSRLSEELDSATNSVIKRGYLHKWRDREISFASKWGLRYFVLQGSQLSYFGDASEHRARRTYDLSSCVVKVEGTKKNGTYHVFGLYVIDRENPEAPPDLLLRLSSEKAVEAKQWVEMLEQACTLAEYLVAIEKATHEKPIRKSSSAEKFQEIMVGMSGFGSISGADDWTNSSAVNLDDDPKYAETQEDLSPIMLKRVRSSNAMLRKVKSRQTMAREIHERRCAALPNAVPAVLVSSGSGSGSGSSSASSKKQIVGSRANEGPVAGASPVKQAFSSNRTVSGSKPMHVSNNHSPLSNDVRPGEQNYRGFFNLGIIILLLSHARLIIDSHVKYGFVPAWRGIKSAAASNNTPAEWALSKPGQSIIQWCVSILTSFLLESLALRGLISERWMLVLNVIVGTCNILLPTLWVWNSQAHPGACMTYLFQSVILWMKLVSYAHANRDLRKAKREHDKAKEAAAAAAAAAGIALPLRSDAHLDELSSSAGGFDANAKPAIYSEYSLSEVKDGVKDLKPPFLRYGQNINLPNLLWFCVAPTLTYQLNYPLASHTRWPHVLTLLFRIGIVTGLLLFAVEQYIVPTLWSSMEPLQKKNIAELVERIIKLAIPNTYVWLLIFYLYFHLWLNLLAELTRFGDRLFYKDWWNARTIETYWRNWNLPVHHWCLRHLCKLKRQACTRRGSAFHAPSHLSTPLFSLSSLPSPFRLSHSSRRSPQARCHLFRLCVFRRRTRTHPQCALSQTHAARLFRHARPGAPHLLHQVDRQALRECFCRKCHLLVRLLRRGTTARGPAVCIRQLSDARNPMHCGNRLLQCKVSASGELIQNITFFCAVKLHREEQCD